MTYKRRDFLATTGLGCAGLLMPAFSFGQRSTTLLNELKIPPLLEGSMESGKKHYALTLQTGNSQFYPDLVTPTIGINGSYLGPTLRFKRDDNVVMQVENTLGEPTTLHWHGMHVPAKADGGPWQIIEHGASWDPEFKIMQKAATLWYHSHLMGKTGEQVYKGLAGMIIIDDEDSGTLGLPSEYGVDDIPIIVQDRRFNEDGSFNYVTSQMDIMTGLFGDTILVNGTLNAVFTPSTSKVRFRLLNAANARTFTFAFDDGRNFQQIASDGGLLEQPLELQMLELAPSERAEIVVDFGDGNPAKLISLAMADSSPNAATGMMSRMHPMNTQRLDLLSIQPNNSLQASPAIAGVLTSIQRRQESDSVRTRRFTLSMVMGMGMMGRKGNNSRGRGGMARGGGNFFINNQAMDMGIVNHQVNLGDTEIWEIFNDSMMMHPFHIHLDQFQILDRNGNSPAANEMGYKDSVKVGPGQTVRIIVRFDNFSDAESPYMYHCHILEHEDDGMMGQFIVV